MTAQSKDAIGMLVKDHKEAKTLFKAYEALTDRSKVGKKKIADQICQALMVHMRLEEELFYPAARAALEDDDQVDEGIVEHASAKDLIEQIQDMDPDDDLYDAKIKVLSEQIDHHVEEEEGEMFPEVRKTDLDLIELRELMIERKEELEAESA